MFYKDYITIPEIVKYNDVTYTVTSVDNYAFTGSEGLLGVTLPNTVTTIGEYNQEIKGETNVEIISVIA